MWAIPAGITCPLPSADLGFSLLELGADHLHGLLPGLVSVGVVVGFFDFVGPYGQIPH